MDITQQIRDVKLDSTINRCRALRTTLVEFGNRTKTSPATQHVIDAVGGALDHLTSYLKALRSDPDLDLLQPDEVEAKVHFATKLLPLIYRLLQLVENSDIAAVPAELAAPLRRELRRHLDGDLILVSATELNYSVTELTPWLSHVYANLQQPLPTSLPPHLYRAAIPSVEYDQALIHCVFAHEIGHPLYAVNQIEHKVLPVDIPQDMLDKLLGALKTALGPPSGSSSPDIVFQSMFTAQINRMVGSWLEEHACDVYGALLFGPAYLQAFIFFITSCSLLDSVSDDHPSPRRRLRLLLKVLKSRYAWPDLSVQPIQLGCFSQTTASFLATWEEIAASREAPIGALPAIAATAIESDAVLDRLISAVTASVGADIAYSEVKYVNDLKTLAPMINAHIPPAEVLGTNGATSASSLVGILNASWECFLGGLSDFKMGLPNDQSNEPFRLRQAFNRFVMKALELNDIVLTWRAKV